MIDALDAEDSTGALVLSDAHGVDVVIVDESGVTERCDVRVSLEQSSTSLHSLGDVINARQAIRDAFWQRGIGADSVLVIDPSASSDAVVAELDAQISARVARQCPARRLRTAGACGPVFSTANGTRSSPRGSCSPMAGSARVARRLVTRPRRAGGCSQTGSTRLTARKPISWMDQCAGTSRSRFRTTRRSAGCSTCVPALCTNSSNSRQASTRAFGSARLLDPEPQSSASQVRPRRTLRQFSRLQEANSLR